MEFLASLPNCMHLKALTQPWEHDLTGMDLLRVARHAEDVGYFGVILPEHFLVPEEHLELTGDHWFHSSTAQAFVAGGTSTIRIGTMLSILPLQHPVITAKALSTLDWLCGGRVFATVGIGWLPEEFEVMGVPFNERGRRTDEYLAAILELWHEERPSFKGEFVSFDGITMAPKPLQTPHPPLWIGGDADAALRRAAKYADGWAPWLTRPEDLASRFDQLRTYPGWDDRPFSVCYSLSALNVGEGHVVTEDPLAAVGTSAQQLVDACGQLVSSGVTHTFLHAPPVDGLEAFFDHMQWVSEEVMPHLR